MSIMVVRMRITAEYERRDDYGQGARSNQAVTISRGVFDDIN